MDKRNEISSAKVAAICILNMAGGAAIALGFVSKGIITAEDGVLEFQSPNIISHSTYDNSPEYTINDYSWNFNGKEYSMSLPINHSMIEEAKYANYNLSYIRYNKENELVQINGADYSKYVDSDIDSALVKLCAENLEEIAENESFSEADTANFVLAFVQSIEYHEDGNGNYCQHTCETLLRKTGDCEDKAVAYADIMNDMGYPSIVLEFPGHAIPAVAPKTEGVFSGASFEAEGLRYYLAESTADGSSVGEINEEYYDETAIYY